MAESYGLARYENVDSDYLEKRRLRPSAGWALLWALGVGAVISGDFFGWNFGLAAGGFWGLAMATLAMAAMYVCMVLCIAELSAALPHAGGFYSFVRSALGPTWGYVCGLTDTVEYVLTPAVVVVAIGSHLQLIAAQLLGRESADLPPYAWLWWVGVYAVFVWINVRGVGLTLKVGLAVTLFAVLALAVFFAGALFSGAFHIDLLFNIEPAPGQSASWMPRGWSGAFAALPFAIWFFLAIEQLPLSAEEAHDVVRDVPRALIFGMATLLVLGLGTLVLNTGVGGGAASLAVSQTPLVDGYRAVFPVVATEVVVALIALTGLVASFHATVYAYGRVLFALSRAGYFPRWISLTGPQRTPRAALVLGALVGLACALALELSGEESRVGAALLNMAVFGAVISYVLVMLSYIALRWKRPEMPRPYRSPLGVPGAALGTALALLALGATLADSGLRPAVLGTALFLAAGLIYYLLHSRRCLVAQAPEEAAALAGSDDSPPGIAAGSG